MVKNKKNNKSTTEKVNSNPVQNKNQNQEQQPKQDKPTPVSVEKQPSIGYRKLLRQLEKENEQELQKVEKIIDQKSSSSSTKKKIKQKSKPNASKSEKPNQETKKLKQDEVENSIEMSSNEKQSIKLQRNNYQKHGTGTKHKELVLNKESGISFDKQETDISFSKSVSENWDDDYNNSNFSNLEAQQSVESDITHQQSSSFYRSKPKEPKQGWGNVTPFNQNTDTRYYKSDQSKSEFSNFSKGPDNWRKGTKGRISEPSYQSRKDDYSDKFLNKSFNYKESKRQNVPYKRHFDEHFQKFMDIIRSNVPVNYEKLSEIKGDLFSAPEDYSLAHCVAEDMAMGAGIAKTFRSKFGNVVKLLNQRQMTGGLAILEEETRFIYYLVTKEQSRGKPTLYTLWQSLQKLKEHITIHNVSKLAIPQIGCGLDRLDWSTVRQMLEYIFKNVEIEINVYILDENAEQSAPETNRRCFVTHAQMKLIDIEPQTGLMYFGSENSFETEEIKSLSSKYNILPVYKRQKMLGEILRVEDKNEVIYGLIIRKTQNDYVDFEVVEKSLKTLRNLVRKDKFSYVGLQAFIDEKDKYLIDKIVALMQFILNGVEIWVCWPDDIKEFCPQQNKPY